MQARFVEEDESNNGMNLEESTRHAAGLFVVDGG